MKQRRKAREVALVVLYQFEVGLDANIFRCFENHLSFYPVNNNIKDFALKLLKGVKENWEFLNNLISKYSKGWRLERILILDRNILRIALFEMFFMEDIPYKVSINEAVEIAKLYSGNESRIFINGILDKVFKKEILKYE